MRAECRARLHRRERLDQGREDHPELHRHRQQDGVEKGVNAIRAILQFFYKMALASFEALLEAAPV